MKSPGDVEAAQLRETQEEAKRLSTEVVRAVEADGPLRRGEQYLVQIPGAWPQGAMTRAEDILGEAGWLQVQISRRVGMPASVCILTCPEEG
jgi:hypothetical protein